MPAPTIPERIASRLCWYDTRSPAYVAPEAGEEARAPRVGCACDNCYYGRDALAVELIAARDALSDALGFVVAYTIAGQKRGFGMDAQYPAPFLVETTIRAALLP